VYECSAELLREQYGFTPQLIATSTTSGPAYSGGNITLTATGINHTVDNTNYAYYIRFKTKENTNTLKLYGVRVTYTVLKTD
jgi:hypothetical protein